jgi:hypothetical protein
MASPRAAIAIVVEEFAGEERYVPIDASHADCVIADCTDRAGHVSPMEVVIHGVACPGDCVDAVTVIDVTVAVVVESIAGARLS